MRCLVGFGVGMPLSPSRLSESFDHVEQEREVGERGRRVVPWAAGDGHVAAAAVRLCGDEPARPDAGAGRAASPDVQPVAGGAGLDVGSAFHGGEGAFWPSPSGGCACRSSGRGRCTRTRRRVRIRVRRPLWSRARPTMRTMWPGRCWTRDGAMVMGRLVVPSPRVTRFQRSHRSACVISYGIALRPARRSRMAAVRQRSEQ